MSRKNQKELVLIQGHEFKTQNSLKDYAAAIKAKYSIGECITGNDREFILEMLKHSDVFYSKAPSDNPAIALGRAKRNTICWYLIDKVSGEKSQISTGHAIKCAFNCSDDIKNIMHDFKEAARETINNQVAKFKRERVTSDNRYISAISGNLLTSNEVHVDHGPPNLFDNLLFQFVTLENINPLKVGIDEGSGGRRTFVKQELKDKWSAYHQANADLRIVSIDEHHELTTKPSNDWSGYIDNLK